MTSESSPLFPSVEVEDFDAHVKQAWAFWESLGSPKSVCAPMVSASELPFRMLTRRYGVDLAYSPMYHARCFNESSEYRTTAFTTCSEDRPLFVQFCANDPEILLTAARRVEGVCDAVDINFGCPQKIAAHGNYGAFLLDDVDLMCKLVATLRHNLKVPVTAKVRLVPNIEDSIEICKRVERAGASVIAIHARTRTEIHTMVRAPRWEEVAAIRAHLSVPVIVNGGIETLADAQRAMEATGAHAAMSAEGLLCNPALFGHVDPGQLPPRVDLAEEYAKLAVQYPPIPKEIKAHMYNFLRRELNHYTDLRLTFGSRQPISAMLALPTTIRQKMAAEAETADGGLDEVHERLATLAVHYRRYRDDDGEVNLKYWSNHKVVTEVKDESLDAVVSLFGSDSESDADGE